MLIDGKESTTEAKDLVTLDDNYRPVTTSLKVAAKFVKGHDDVLKSIRRLDCSPEFRGGNFTASNYLTKQGKKKPMVEMTRDGFTFLVMGFTGATAAKFKEEYISAFNNLEEEQRKKQTAFDPSSLTRLDILQMAVDSEKRALTAEDRVQKLETVTKRMVPKAKFFDAVSNARGNVNLTAAAKMLGRGPNKMTALLRDLGILYYTRNGINVPAQRHINGGHFVVKTAVDHPGGDISPRTPLHGETTWPTTIYLAHANFCKNARCVFDRHSIRGRVTQ